MNVQNQVIYLKGDSNVFRCNSTAIPVASTDCAMKNEKQKFEDIYSQNCRKIMYFANSYLNDMDEAKNVTNDVFITLWKNMSNIEQEKVVAYIFITAKNMCLNILKRRTIIQKYNSYKFKTDYLNSIALENNEATYIYEKDMEEIMLKGIKLMKTKVRRTFMLSRIKGLKNREIADMEGVVESTVEARITSALLIMRKMLHDYIK